MLRNRRARTTDAPLIASWLMDEFPPLAAANGALAAALGTWFEAERVSAAITEERPDEGGSWRPKAIGISVFAASGRIDRHLDAPVPFLFGSLTAEALGDPAVLLDGPAVAAGNAGHGLDLVAHYMQAGWDLTDPLWRSVGILAHEAYVRDHRGYRLSRALQEDWARDFEIYAMMGYCPHAEFHVADGGGLAAPGTGRRRILYYADAGEVVKRAPGTSVSYVFQFAAPRCHFTPGERRVLLHAVEDMTDQEIAEALDVSPNAVKLAWRSIYQRVECEVPALLGGGGETESDGRRGLEKRRHLVAFVKDHPQELRPYNSGRR